MGTCYEWMGTKSYESLLRLDDGGYPLHRRACRSYGSWATGHSIDVIAQFQGITAEDVQDDIEHIKALLGEKCVAVQTRDRDEILGIQARCKLLERHANRVPTATELLKAGKDPAVVLRKLRQGAMPELSKQDFLSESYSGSTEGNADAHLLQRPSKAKGPGIIEKAKNKQTL